MSDTSRRCWRSPETIRRRRRISWESIRLPCCGDSRRRRRRNPPRPKSQELKLYPRNRVAASNWLVRLWSQPRAPLDGRHFDVAIIGGGINGVAIARECARAGRRTLLVEQNDFASGTTSRSTRIIHGGLRYLEHGEIGLVRESLRERERLLHIAPHLVRPLEILVPIYKTG